ncbi:hypothetical protein KGM_203844 [Danaus plexippus plexippus]|uniref:Uncharacterized protein n=1 Tax=Danaus plexippus plexippus TaxID=278856 RepID=A0A212F5A3_DANPL|nr:hypothetical protein KGM_203844 [Danaus plexippus plexippus]
MGSNTSKTSPEPAAPSQKNDSDKDNPDPRSPTPEITRTPLQGKNGGKHNITKNVDLRKTFESGKTDEKLIHNNPILSAVIKNHLQSYDPRSPSQDFERTPIIIASKTDNDPDKKLLKLQSENYGSPCLSNETIKLDETSFDTNEISPDLVVPKNLCNGFYDLTLNDSLKEDEEPLGSSTTSNENIESNMSKEHNEAAKLLETNFEFVETESNSIEERQCGETHNNVKNMDVDLKHVPLFKILNEDPRSPSTGIERTPIVVSKIDVNTSEENVENMSDDSLIKALQNNGQDISPESIPVYEDESKAHIDTPKKVKATSDSGSRTPLSCMKNRSDASHTRSKSTNMLYDPKKEKIQKRVSHIPRLKSLSKQPKYITNGSTVSLKNLSKAAISGDCENTPPHSHRDIWDKESSIVL